ncbi:MAG TPA: ammonium transporter [Allosphingosinicella sp.]|nr:ammonium transporter [Allosphingosinicella sp.]
MMIKRLAFALALAILILAVAGGLRYAEDAGMVGAEGARRTLQILIGLVLAAYANLMPKRIGRARRSPKAEAVAQAALRVGGWSLTLAGLAYAGLWAFAPLAIADIASMAVVATALAATLGYALWSFTACRSAERATVGR